MCEKRDCILIRWRTAMAAKGVSPLPTDRELTEICTQGRIPESASPAVAAWGHVIAFLQSQSRFGVTWDGIHLTPELMTPQPVTPAAAPGPARPRSPMERLKAWRDRAVDEGRLARGAVNESHLMLLNRPLSSPEDVGRRVPALSAFAAEVFDLLRSGPGAGSAADDADEMTRTRPRSAMNFANTAPTALSGAASGGLSSRTSAPTPPAPTTGREPVYPSTSRYPGAAATQSPSAAPATSPPTSVPAPAAPAAAGGAFATVVDPRTSPGPTTPSPAARTSPTGPPVVLDDRLVDEDDPALQTGYAETLSVADRPASTVIERVVEHGQGTYRWPALAGAVTLYRVVVSEGQRPLVPEMGDTLAATRATTVLDPVPVTSLFRFVQVWANVGDTVAAAKAAQPRLHAECVRVGTIAEASGSADYGQVALVWTAPAGAHRIRVYRLPGGAEFVRGYAAFEICADRANLTGCVDRGGEAGASYTYRMVVEARDSSGGAHTSEPVDVNLEWPAVIREITDLTIQPVQPPTRFDPGLVDLEWTPPPVGATQIYRIDQPVGAGILGVEADKGALPQMGFTDQERCKNPIEPRNANGRVRMLGVVWPPGWSRVHFVPVTVIGQRALPGKPATGESIAPPGDPRLVDRVTQQVITFVWPSGATYVRAYLGPSGADPKDVCHGQWHAQVSEDDYRRHGGLRLQLPASELDVFLVAVRGETTSVAVSVHKPQRLLVRYAVDIRRRMKVGPVDYGRVVVWAPDEKVQGSPPFVVVFRDDRLPLHARDGAILPAVPDETPDAAVTQVIQPATLMGGPDLPRWRVLVPGGAGRGYLRLFVSPSVGTPMLRRIVVLDPPITQLRWG